jgi:four helix bundle protein
MTSGMKDLKVWQEAVALAGEVVRAVRQGTRRETKTFTDQMMQSAVAVASSIAQGYASYAPEEQRLSYSDARRALLDLETRLTIARHAGVIQPAVLAQLGGRLATVSRLLAGYVAYLDRQADQSGIALPGLANSLRMELLDDREIGSPRV